ncbi:MAG: hypothetical protein A2V98_16810 [Planctomycetes bacterium RBG_16_64_12]|nr:MAG: hypothetical protein A2V98_16810 [Planctomycetes bacterium RBG_16_64_12]
MSAETRGANMAAESSTLAIPVRELYTDCTRAKVVFYVGEQPDVEKTARRLFGRMPETWEYAGLAGAPDDAQVDVGTLCGGLYLDMYRPLTISYRAVELVRQRGGGPIVVIDGMQIHYTMQRKGLGLQIFARQLATARNLGVVRIETTAGRHRSENGYYTWPRFGFDGPLPPKVKRHLPLGLDQAQNVLDLMGCPKGRLWWRAYGTSLRLAFDVTAYSRSWDVFLRYLGRKGLPFL